MKLGFLVSIAVQMGWARGRFRDRAIRHSVVVPICSFATGARFVVAGLKIAIDETSHRFRRKRFCEGRRFSMRALRFFFFEVQALRPHEVARRAGCELIFS